MAAAVLEGWTPIRWILQDGRQNAALRMDPPETGMRKSLSVLLTGMDAEFFACCMGYRSFKEKPWTAEAHQAFASIEAKLGQRPTR